MLNQQIKLILPAKKSVNLEAEIKSNDTRMKMKKNINNDEIYLAPAVYELETVALAAFELFRINPLCQSNQQYQLLSNSFIVAQEEATLLLNNSI